MTNGRHVYSENFTGKVVVCSCGQKSPSFQWSVSRREWFQSHVRTASQKTS